MEKNFGKNSWWLWARWVVATSLCDVQKMASKSKNCVQ